MILFKKMKKDIDFNKRQNYEMIRPIDFDSEKGTLAQVKDLRNLVLPQCLSRETRTNNQPMRLSVSTI